MRSSHFEQEVLAVFADYDLDTAIVGHVIAGHQYQLYHHGKLVCDVPVSSLTDDAPIYHQQGKMPKRLAQLAADFDPIITDSVQIWADMMAMPTIADKSSLYKRYDAQVQTNTVVLPGSDAAVIRIRCTHRALAMTTDSKDRYLYLDPLVGAAMSVAEVARNLVASGEEPLVESPIASTLAT